VFVVVYLPLFRVPDPLVNEDRVDPCVYLDCQPSTTEAFAERLTLNPTTVAETELAHPVILTDELSRRSTTSIHRRHGIMQRIHIRVELLGGSRFAAFANVCTSWS
jgi:hypothetical protein